MNQLSYVPQVTWTDCRSLYEMLNKEGSVPGEKRVALDLMDIRQFLDKDQLRWISTHLMLADPLTKHIPASEATALRALLRDGRATLSACEDDIVG